MIDTERYLSDPRVLFVAACTGDTPEGVIGRVHQVVTEADIPVDAPAPLVDPVNVFEVGLCTAYMRAYQVTALAGGLQAMIV